MSVNTNNNRLYKNESFQNLYRTLTKTIETKQILYENR